MAKSLYGKIKKLRSHQSWKTNLCKLFTQLNQNDIKKNSIKANNHVEALAGIPDCVRGFFAVEQFAVRQFAVRKMLVSVRLG